MPIVGLTDKKPQYPQIGVLRKGGKKTDPKKPGPDLTYFRFDSPDASASAAFAQVYGNEPVSIRVILPFADLDDNFEAWREEYTAGSLRHRCDGQTMTQWLQKDGTYSFNPKTCTGGCKPTGRLKVIIPDLGRMAIVMVLTTSIHDIMNLHANLSALQEASGSLRGIPLTLRRVPKQISTPAADGKRARREKWLIQIEPEASWVQLQLQAQQERALAGIAGTLPATQQLALNAAPEDLDEDDEDEIVEAEIDPAEPLIAEIRAIWDEMGAPGWDAYFTQYLDGKPIKAVEKCLAAVRAKADKKRAEAATDTSPDDLLASIERECAALLAAGAGQEDINEVIAATANGVYDLNDLLPESFPAVLDALLKLRAAAEAHIAKAKA